ncbi:related to formin binding protein [Ramularia collo-cygni]|uniref:Related to formin binding protein n=1 Tax=Ramularia collo-cygni TaxID=112498 RepID=A0A2D3V8R3_9PEZI|nr:related to formin binding protein [Ramularia collo-cygni]CZT16773.1 related to formin binding protein [Ramularia collo-cygni]
MSEYWKSTPSYWCKFCSQYVRDSPLERKNHDASGRHQNNISRSLRELHKNKERETRDQQRAKDEVARLNGLFSDKPGGARDAAKPVGSTSRATPAPTNVNSAEQRKAHAEQLAAMGVALPEELQKQVTGVGNYHVVSERRVEPSEAGVVSGSRSLAEILAEAKGEPSEVEEEQDAEEGSKTAPKRKLEHDENEDEEGEPKRKAWGSNFKTYPAVKDAADDDFDLDALLSGVVRKKEPAVKAEGDDSVVKQEDDASSPKPLSSVPDVGQSEPSHTKPESASEAAPAVVFKKRKGKK